VIHRQQVVFTTCPKAVITYRKCNLMIFIFTILLDIPTLKQIYTEYKLYFCSATKLRHFFAAPALGGSFDAAPALASPTPTLLYSKPTFLKQAKVNLGIGLFSDFL
jgi:hypothetical protein